MPKVSDDELRNLLAEATPGPWHYEPGGGHAYNRVCGSESVQVHGWPERRNGISNASYSNRICENLGDTELDGPAANARLIALTPDMARELLAARAMMKMAKKEGFGCRAEDNCGSPLCAAIRNYDEVVK